MNNHTRYINLYSENAFMNEYQIEYLRDRTHISYLSKCTHYCTHSQVAKFLKVKYFIYEESCGKIKNLY